MNNLDQSIVFRADGDGKIGLGHLIRSSALASMLKEHFKCILATRCQLQSVVNELQSSFSNIIILKEDSFYEEAYNFRTIALNSSLIVLDGYSFDEAYQKILIGNGFDLFSIDDIHSFKFHSDVIINHSGGLTPLDYKSKPSTKYYLGPYYSLLRKPFLEASKNRRNKIVDNNCFVCFGGADPNNKTLDILKSPIVNAGHFDHFHVVIGNGYSYKRELQEFIKDRKNITLHVSVSDKDMVSIMKQCSFAICSPSSIVYEYLSVGGIAFLEQIADNQTDVINYFIQDGMAFGINEIGRLSDSEVEKAFEKNAYYFDGNSNNRFIKIFQQHFEGKKILIRIVKSEDLMCCYNWANDPAVRGQSYNQEPITLEQHISWFNEKLEDQNCYYYILELGGKAIGQIRFQVSDNEVVLGYLADNSIRSKGLGTTILSKGIEKFIYDYKAPVKLVGYVKKTNIASQRSFEKLAFRKEETLVYPDSFKYTMIYEN